MPAHTADLGFMAYNAGRAADVDFSAPWLLMPNSYIVRGDSPLQKVEDADLFLYPGDQHYFADSSLPSYDADATALLTRRVLEFLDRV